MDHFGISKYKVTGFLKKAFIWLDKKEASTFIDGARFKKGCAKQRERKRMILQKIFDIARGGLTNIYNMYNW